VNESAKNDMSELPLVRQSRKGNSDSHNDAAATRPVAREPQTDQTPAAVAKSATPTTPPPRDPHPFITPCDLRVHWLSDPDAYGPAVYFPPRGTTVTPGTDDMKRHLFYRLTPEVWAWVWQRAVKLEDMVFGDGREDLRRAYDQLTERIGPLVAWVVRRQADDDRDRGHGHGHSHGDADSVGWTGGAWRKIARPRLPAVPWCPRWV
jgi:hypothetical protein